MYRTLCIMVMLAIICGSGCHHEPQTSQLLEDLNSAKSADRLKAVRWLQNRPGDAADVVPALVRSLNDSETDIRLSAAIGLGYFGSDADSALPELEKRLADKDVRVRRAAEVAISRIQGEE
ncbi:MAG: HEAT repeat domain-containing protein [Planctomycetes bacterium]|nr:HEAT repeat domain-containing protein [Planctomycetota bacterium]